MLTMDLMNTYETTSLKEHYAFVNQGQLLLEPTIHHHKVFSTITPEKPSNFGQALKGPDRVNCIKGAFEQYDENTPFGLLTAPFTRVNLPRTTCVLWYVLDLAIKKSSDKIYCYWPRHCANGGPQLKGIEFDQYSYTFIKSPTPRMIFAIATTYDITIGIMDVTNDLQNNIKASYDREIIDCPSHDL